MNQPLTHNQNVAGHALGPGRRGQRRPPRRGGREPRERAGPHGGLPGAGRCGGGGLGAMPARREEPAAVRVESPAVAPGRLEALPWRLGEVLQRPHGGERGEGLRPAVEEPGQAPLEGELRHEAGHLEAARPRARGGGRVVVELRRRARGRLPRRRGRRADVLLLLTARGGLLRPPAAEQEVRLHIQNLRVAQVRTPIGPDETQAKIKAGRQAEREREREREREQ